MSSNEYSINYNALLVLNGVSFISIILPLLVVPSWALAIDPLLGGSRLLFGCTSCQGLVNARMVRCSLMTAQFCAAQEGINSYPAQEETIARALQMKYITAIIYLFSKHFMLHTKYSMLYTEYVILYQFICYTAIMSFFKTKCLRQASNTVSLAYRNVTHCS